MLAVCTGVAYLLYLALRPALPLPSLESDPIFDHHDGFGLLLKKNLRDARVVVPARPHPLPFRPLDPEYADRITKRAVFTCSTNAERFRGTRSYSAQPDPDVVRIVAVGDSITFGHGVNDHETFPHLLEERLGPGFQVVNAGVPGQDSQRAILDLDERVLPLEPHIVVVCTGVNEISYSPERSEEDRLQLWLSEERYLLEEQEFADNLVSIERACVAAGARLVLLVPPVNSFSPYPDGPRFCRIVRQLARQRGIPSLDLQAAFSEVEERDGLALIHQIDSQTIVQYHGGRPQQLLYVPVTSTRSQYVSDFVYNYLDHEPAAMTLSLDGSHPNAQGMELIAQLVEPVITEIVEADPTLQVIRSRR